MSMENRFTEIEQFENGTAKDKIITLKSVYKDGTMTVQPAFSPATGWFLGVAELSEEEKKKSKYYVKVGLTGLEARQNTRLKLKEGFQLDLSKERDAINWQWLKHLPCIAMSFEEAQRSKAYFYVHIEAREAEIRNKKTDRLYEALSYIRDDAPTNYPSRALLLGTDMEHEPLAVIKEFLDNKAKENPESIIRIYTHRSLKLYLLFHNAVKANIIRKNYDDNTYRYGTVILGINEELAVNYLSQKENQDILTLIDKQVFPAKYSGNELVTEIGPSLAPSKTELNKAETAVTSPLEEVKSTSKNATSNLNKLV